MNLSDKLYGWLQATKSRGVVVLVGLAEDPMSVPIMNAALREITIKGSNAYANE